MNPIFVISQSDGEYSARTEEVIAAFKMEEKAEAFVELAERCVKLYTEAKLEVFRKSCEPFTIPRPVESYKDTPHYKELLHLNRTPGGEAKDIRKKAHDEIQQIKSKFNQELRIWAELQADHLEKIKEQQETYYQQLIDQKLINESPELIALFNSNKVIKTLGRSYFKITETELYE